MIQYLKSEKSTAKNIKSDQTRHAVESNLERCIQRLKHVKSGGFALFSGNENLYEVEYHGVSWNYQCGKQLNLIPMSQDLNSNQKVIGCLSMDLTECSFAYMSNGIHILKSISSGIPSKHRAGGQSSQRFKHLREEAKRNWFKRIAEYARDYFLNDKTMDKLIIHGESFTKREFVKSNLLEYRLQKKVVLSDGCYAGEDGLYELKNMMSL